MRHLARPAVYSLSTSSMPRACATIAWVVMGHCMVAWVRPSLARETPSGAAFPAGLPEFGSSLLFRKYIVLKVALCADLKLVCDFFEPRRHFTNSAKHQG